MADQNSRDRRNIDIDRSKPPLHLDAGETDINQDPGLSRLNKSTIAFAATAQNTKSHRLSLLTKNL